MGAANPLKLANQN